MVPVLMPQNCDAFCYTIAEMNLILLNAVFHGCWCFVPFVYVLVFLPNEKFN